MLTYDFSKSGNESLYVYLYQCIKEDIVRGKLPADTRLPSKRSFSKNLGISTITVENAYDQLISEGYIYSIAKKGYFVAKLNTQPPMLQRTEQESIGEIMDQSDSSYEYFADFSSNQTDSEQFPFSTWAKLVREILNDNRNDLMKNSPPGGILVLREAIASHLREFRGMKVTAKQIIVGAGTEYLYGLLIQLLGTEKRYGVENPGYQKITQIYQSHHVHCDFLPMDHAGILVSELEKNRTDIVHISPSHHFPTGRVMPISRRYELLSWASKSDQRYIVEDDYDSEFRLNGQLIPTMQSIDVMNKVIYMNTFSKTLSSTVRISYMVLPLSLMREFNERLSFYSCTVSNFEQYTLAKFIQGGYFEKHINRVRNYYVKKRNEIIHAILNSRLKQTINIMEEDAGLHFLIRVATTKEDEQIVEKAKQKGIRLNPLSHYYHDPKEAQKHVFVINYTSLKREQVRECIKRLEEVFATT